MIPKNHQYEKAKECWQIMLKYRYVYLQGLPRSGKTLTALLIAEMSKRIQSVLILTPKAAIPGWDKFINDEELQQNELTKNYTVTNYEQVGRIGLRTHTKTGKELKHPVKEFQFKLNSEDYDLIIIDESHRLGKLGSPSQRYKVLAEFCKDKPHIHLSGTAIVESPNSIYYQMHLPQYTPFKDLDTFYDYFRVFGKPSVQYIGRVDPITGEQAPVPKYDLAKPALLEYIEQFTVRMTQEDAGISKDIQASDTIHYVALTETTKKLYNRIQKDRVVSIHGQPLVCDTTMKLRTSLHMLEGGIVKIDDEYISVGNLEKIEYIKKTWGDHPKLAIMANFIGERQLIKEHFEHAKIFSSTSHAEGTDLSDFDDFVIYSSGYSGSKFIQRRERTVNMMQTSQSIVHHLICKGAISSQVYFTCSDKQDFNNKTYRKDYL